MKRLACLFSLFFLFWITAPLFAAESTPSPGAVIYQQSCAGCHETGTANSPRRSDGEFWKKRLAEAGSQTVLVNHVILGLGAMPPKGGCMNCTEDQLRDATIYLLGTASAAAKPPNSGSLPLEQLKLPEGFSIRIYADQLPGARMLTLGKDGVVFVGTRGQGKVYALIPPKNPSEPVQKLTLLSGLNEPNGVAYHNGDLYVAEIQRILKYPKIDTHLQKVPRPVVVNDTLPTEKWHGYRVIDVGPDGNMYIAIGMPCNTCDYRKSEPLFGTIARMSLEGKDLVPYAVGVRNSVGFAWHPQTKELWFTDNGQDLIGDDAPPDEINRAPKEGLDFGFPYVYGKNILAPGYTQKDIAGRKFETPSFELPAHVAPLGMAFYTGKKFPQSYQDKIFVALHGSWNRSKKIGYEVVQLNLEGNRVKSMEPFVSGWLQGQNVWGRPVALLNMPDGSMLISDDLAGVIYQINYK